MCGNFDIILDFDGIFSIIFGLLHTYPRPVPPRTTRRVTLPSAHLLDADLCLQSDVAPGSRLQGSRAAARRACSREKKREKKRMQVQVQKDTSGHKRKIDLGWSNKISMERQPAMKATTAATTILALSSRFIFDNRGPRRKLI